MPEKHSINLIVARRPATTGREGSARAVEPVAARFARCTSLQSVANAMLTALQAYGFRYGLYGGRFRQTSGDVRQIILSGYPKDWITRYLADDCASIDPVIEAVYTQPTPVIWHAEMFDTPARRALWQRAEEAGMQRGVTVPVAAGSNEVALLSAVCCNNADCALPADDATLAHLYLVAAHTHDAVRRVISPNREKQAQPVALSGRERECLSLWLTGKTAEAIGGQLAVSARTVRFHLGNAKLKLGARNRTEALSKALAMGLVRP